MWTNIKRGSCFYWPSREVADRESEWGREKLKSMVVWRVWSTTRPRMNWTVVDCLLYCTWKLWKLAFCTEMGCKCAANRVCLCMQFRSRDEGNAAAEQQPSVNVNEYWNRNRVTMPGQRRPDSRFQVSLTLPALIYSGTSQLATWRYTFGTLLLVYGYFIILRNKAANVGHSSEG